MAIVSQFPDSAIPQLTESGETSTAQTGNNNISKDPSRLQVPAIGMRPRKNSNSSDITSCNSSETTSLMERLSILSSANSIESSTSWGSSSSSNDLLVEPTERETQVPSGTTIIHGSKRQAFLQDMFVTRRSCHYNCHCQCHEMAAEQPKRRLTSGSKSRRLQCTDPTCVGNEFSEAAAEEYSRSFRKVMTFFMSAKNVDVRYNLKTFRMIPEGSDAMRYVKHGNLEKLKGCIESGEATIWDTAPDGWSLLHASCVFSDSS